MRNATFISNLGRAILKGSVEEVLKLRGTDRINFTIHISANHYTPLLNVLSNGNLPMFRCLVEEEHINLAKLKVERLFFALSAAVKNGHLDILVYIEEKHPELVKTFIAKNANKLIALAAANGHIKLIQYVFDHLADEDKKSGTHYDDFQAFRVAAEGGHLPVVEFLADTLVEQRLRERNEERLQRGMPRLTSDEIDGVKNATLSALFRARDYQAFRRAAAFGHTEVLEFLLAKDSKNGLKMLEAFDYEAFSNAAFGNHFTTVRFLVERFKDAVPAMLAANKFIVFRHTAEAGNLPMLTYLTQQTPKQTVAISANNYAAFSLAFMYGHFDVAYFLADVAPDELEAMVNAYIHSEQSKKARHNYYPVCNDGRLQLGERPALITATTGTAVTPVAGEVPAYKAALTTNAIDNKVMHILIQTDAELVALLSKKSSQPIKASLATAINAICAKYELYEGSRTHKNHLESVKGYTKDIIKSLLRANELPDSEAKIHITRDVKTAAATHLHHRHYGWRIAADIAIILSGLFLIAYPARFCQGKSIFLSQDKTNRQKQFEEAIQTCGL